MTCTRLTLARSAALLAGASLIISLAGCGTQGKYTQEGVAKAKDRVAQIKSGTEWQMGQQQFLAGDLTKALKSVDRSLALNPTVPKSHILRGRILIEQGDLEGARASLLKAEELAPDNVDAQYYIGIVHERFNQPEDALARYQKAMELDPKDAQYLTAAAEQLVQLNRLQEGRELLESKQATFQYNPAVRQTLGHIAMLEGRPKDAVRLFEEALLLQPESVAILEDLVRAQVDAHLYADAEFNVNRLLSKPEHKDRRDLLMLRAKCLVMVNRPVEARAILAELTNSSSGQRDVQAWRELGHVAAKLKDRPYLRQASTRLIALAPDRHEGYLFRAIVQRMDKQMTESLASLDLAVTRSGNDASPWLLRSLVLKDLGRNDESFESLRMAAKTDPSNTDVQALLGTTVPSPAGRTVVGTPEAAE